MERWRRRRVELDAEVIMALKYWRRALTDLYCVELVSTTPFASFCHGYNRAPAACRGKKCFLVLLAIHVRYLCEVFQPTILDPLRCSYLSLSHALSLASQYGVPSCYSCDPCYGFHHCGICNTYAQHVRPSVSQDNCSSINPTPHVSTCASICPCGL